MQSPGASNADAWAVRAWQFPHGLIGTACASCGAPLKPWQGPHSVGFAGASPAFAAPGTLTAL
jgi:hypothetical protein